MKPVDQMRFFALQAKIKDYADRNSIKYYFFEGMFILDCPNAYLMLGLDKILRVANAR